MRIAFTLCSNNYLAQAKTLGDSFIEHNPNCQFMIGLVDRKSNEIDYDFFRPHEIVEVETIGIPNFDELWKKYGIIELNTAVKAFFFIYFFGHIPDVQSVVYLDPDIMVFNSLKGIDDDLDKHSLVIVPHILSPIALDNHIPQESIFLIYGIYNLGFIGVANTPEGFRFLTWWSQRTHSLGHIKTESGLFTDQLWVNLVPILFKNVQVSLDPGLDVAYWNLHERTISVKDNAFVVNDHSPLVFYHFSSYNPSTPALISIYQDRYSFHTRPDIANLFSIYNEKIKANKHAHFSAMTCHFVTERAKYLESEKWNKKTTTRKMRIVRRLKRMTPSFVKDAVFAFIKMADALRNY